MARSASNARLGLGVVEGKQHHVEALVVLAALDALIAPWPTAGSMNIGSFASTLVAALEKPVRAWAQCEAIGEWLAGRSGGFVPVAEIVPARVVGEVLGLPEGDASRFRKWAMIGGDLLAGNLDETRLAAIAGEAVKMSEYLGGHLDRAGRDLRRDPDAPLMHFLAAAVKEDRISRGAALVIASTLFSAGGESTAALIGNMARCLAERADVAHRLRERRELISRFVEEVARLDAPFNFHYRVVQRDCELAGCELGEGDRRYFEGYQPGKKTSH